MIKRLLSIALLIALCGTSCEAPFNWRGTAKVAGLVGGTATVTAAATILMFWRLLPAFTTAAGRYNDGVTQQLDSDKWTDQHAMSDWKWDNQIMFGYDTHTNELPAASNTNHHTVVIFSHPFPGDYSEASIQEMLGAQFNQVAHLNFKYRTCSSFMRGGISELMFFRCMNLGGTLDAMVAARHAKLAVEKGYTNIIFWGHSRGCAAILTLLDMADPSRRAAYEKVWKQIGCVDQNRNIDNAKIDKIWNAIKYIVAAKPLISRLSTYRNVASQISPWLKTIGGRAIKLGLHPLTDCNIFDAEPLDILKRLKNENKLPSIHLTVAEDDEVVSSENNEEVRRILSQNNDARHQYVCEAQGHNEPGTSIKHLQSVAQSFAQQN